KAAHAQPSPRTNLRRKPKAPAKAIAADLEKPACVPEEAAKEAQLASPTACAPDDASTTKSRPDNEAAVIKPAEDAAEPESPPVKKTAKAKPRLWKKFKRKSKAPAKTIAADLEKPACVPEDAEKEAHLASPAACAPDDVNTTKSRPDNEADVITPAEDTAEPESPPVKETIRTEPGLWKFKRKPKMPARTITVDLEKLAYVPEALKILRTSDGQLKPPPPAKPAALPDTAKKEPPLAGPTAAPADTGNVKIRPDNEAAKTRLPDDVAEPESLPEAAASDTHESPLKTAPKPKTANPVIIAQDELDGLLSSLLAEADSDRS
ncbi:MAG: hypothetical protein OER56_03280, partial [Hyphomicrobiales bacterium]|nr:hypothetical protein [Hyphomicrobiales bacterium]